MATHFEIFVEGYVSIPTKDNGLINAILFCCLHPRPFAPIRIHTWNWRNFIIVLRNLVQTSWTPHR